MKKIYVDYRVPSDMVKKLESFGYSVDSVLPNPFFSNSVCGHPDMNILKIDDVIFATTNVRFFDSRNVMHVQTTGDNQLYPNDALLNAVCIGNDFICRTKSVHIPALECAKEKGYNIINVNQGYVKCNICVVDSEHKAVITEDEGIAKTLLGYGYDVLLLTTHCVNLEPYEYGFIGGASGLIDCNMFFLGCIEKHCEYEKIRSFCAKYSVNLISLSENELYDYGSIVSVADR